MRYSSRKKRKYIIIGLCLVLLLMIVGYASFSTVLTINSSSEITSSWDVEITNVRGINDASLTYNDAYDKNPPSISESKLSVTIQTGLLSPGDTRIYEIEVSNLGNLDSEVTTSFQNKINDSTLFTYDGVSPVGSVGTDILTSNGSYDPSLLETEEPFFIPAFTNNKRYIYLTIKYKDSVTSQPKDLNPSVTLTLDVKQKSHDSSTSSFGVETVTVGGIEIPVVNSGDGLYYDDYTDSYVFKGGNPDNYISFNNEVWRIMSIDNNRNIKIIKDERIDLTGYESPYSGIGSSNYQGKFDSAGFRVTGYCSLAHAITYGCNVWSSTSNMVGTPAIFTNENYSGVVSNDSELNIFLNGVYKSFLQSSEEWGYVKTGMSWSIGPSGTYNDSNNIQTLVEMENEYKWIGDIALATKSEYMRANNNLNCLTTFNLRSNSNMCSITNYLYKEGYWWWLLSPYLGYPDSLLNVDKYVSGTNPGSSNGSVRPSLYLKSNITLAGNGTNDENIFSIVS